jgi:hypothetical protein
MSPAPFSDPRTSADAARSMRPHLGRLEGVVLAFIAGRGPRGATDEEVEDATLLKHQTASARRRELVLRGLVRDSGATRPTSSGRKAVAWVATT